MTEKGRFFELATGDMPKLMANTMNPGTECDINMQLAQGVLKTCT